MKLREIKVKNFRSLVEVTIPIDDTTILVGENNSGKTALLETLKMSLPRSSMGRGRFFDEYDYYMSKIGDSPQTSEGIVIELWFKEDKSDEWANSMVQALNDIIQTDPIRDLDYIGLRLQSKYDPIEKDIISKWEFLNLEGKPLGGKGANSANLGKFFSFMRLFYLSALRDCEDEFSPRSQFWGALLRNLKISEDEKNNLSAELAKINKALLKADPRLEQVRSSLENIEKIMALGTGKKTSIQAMPLKPWELMSKSKVIIKGRGSEVDFPLLRHGQGMQSLAVLFLFQAYIDVLLKPTFQPETEAILALEEPEAHLHPQATRALAANLAAIKGQKIIATHSPYFVQEVPFTQIRMFRRNGPSSEILYIKRFFTSPMPNESALLEFCTNNTPKYEYHKNSSILQVNGKMEEKEYRKLLTIYPEQTKVHEQLKQLYKDSQSYLADSELADLDTYAKRIRGEVLFARAWLLCEGQSEYLLLRYFSELLEKPLDHLGITVIDFQNNGSPGAFVGLAQAFNVPWIMTCDNDTAGKEYIAQVKSRGLTDVEVKELVRSLPEEGQDLEMFLVKNGFLAEYLLILAEWEVTLSKKKGDVDFEKEVASKLKKKKTESATALIQTLRKAKADKTRVPSFFAKLINDIAAKIE